MILSKKNQARITSDIYCRLRLDSVFGAVESLYANSIKILVYHRVVDAPENINFPYDDSLIEAGVSQFEQHMRYVSHNYDVITFSEIINFLDNGGNLPKRPLLITFDDGYNDIYKYAYPIIREMRIPATLFLATGYIGGSRTFWYDWLAFIVLNTPDLEIVTSSPDFKIELGNSRAERYSAFNQLMGLMRSMSNDERDRLLAAVEEKYGSVYTEQTDQIKNMSKPLTWAQVKEMSSSMVEIGSHTVSHPFLSKVSPEQLFNELHESKATIEKEIGKDVCVLAYPNGQKSDFNDQVLDMARKVGYKISLSYIHGVNVIGDFDRYAMRRLHMPMGDSINSLRLLLTSSTIR